VVDGSQPPPDDAVMANIDRPSRRVMRETDSKDSSASSLVKVHEIYM
jgi:hypothetical protein